MSVFRFLFAKSLQFFGSSVNVTDIATAVAWPGVDTKLITEKAARDALTALIPPGVMTPYAGSSAPTGWLLCNGAAVSRSTYAALFAAIGTTYGAGDGSTTFALPDARGRTMIGAGQGAGLTNRTLGATGGEEAHALTSGENGVHEHQQTSNTGAPYYEGTGGSGIKLGGNASTSNGSAENMTESSGSGTPHENMQPFIVVNYMIKY